MDQRKMKAQYKGRSPYVVISIACKTRSLNNSNGWIPDKNLRGRRKLRGLSGEDKRSEIKRMRNVRAFRNKGRRRTSDGFLRLHLLFFRGPHHSITPSLFCTVESSISPSQNILHPFIILFPLCATDTYSNGYYMGIRYHFTLLYTMT